MIIFKKLRYQNLLSTGNQFTELDLNRSSSTLVVGANGAGKSTFIEALTFALYGKAFRDINKPQLINSITGKNLLVEVEFSIGSKEYMVRRGIKPNIFEIYQDGSLLNQNARNYDYQEEFERNVLKLNFKSFTQIVVLGSANYVPFMQMKSAERRKVVEDLLDIQIFSVMNSLLKDKVQQNKADISNIDYTINLCEQKIDMHKKHINSLKANNDELIQQKEDKIAEHEKSIAAHQEVVNETMIVAEALNQEISDQGKLEGRKTKLLQFESTFEDKLRNIKKEIQFYHDYDNCPTCKQGIDHTFKQETIDSRKAKETEFQEAMTKLEDEIVSTNERLHEIGKINSQIHTLNEHIQHNNQQIRFLNRYIVDLNVEIDSLREHGRKIKTNADETKKYLKELDEYTAQKESLSNQKALYDVAGVLLKDTGIKTKIIKQYVPVMNKLINKYLAAMDFFVNFELDESFNETLKSRFRDEFSYASFSEGEKLRIDLALMFTWRAIAKLRNSASTNLLIMDEVFDSSLDAAGTEEFLKILETLTSDSNVFIISHKGDQLYDKFHSVIRFEKQANFSRIAA